MRLVTRFFGVRAGGCRMVGMSAREGVGGGVAVLVEIILGLSNVLAKGLVFQFAVVTSRLEKIAGRIGDLGLVDFFRFVAESGLRRLSNKFGAGKKLIGGVFLVRMAVAVVGIRIHRRKNVGSGREKLKEEDEVIGAS
ncbi:hypothetical protein QN277_004207 [Acacia crassicarpa]|uniref:Uncharacterized protein n=1 Tax=Acacia crassicarpa TaxID=499986 RepID=A0AAE1JXI5_9FABA|nr:hypothetical protein QN277_004207 [Acacia crassicarpa]